jgi:hypothetical protein
MAIGVTVHQIIFREGCLLKQINESETFGQERVYQYIAIASFSIAKTYFLNILLLTSITSRVVYSQLALLSHAFQRIDRLMFTMRKMISKPKTYKISTDTIHTLARQPRNKTQRSMKQW